MTAWNIMPYFALTLPDRPGELACFIAQLADAEVNMIGMWSAPAGEGNGPQHRLTCVPESAERFRRFFHNSGLSIEEGRAFYLCDEDRPGALVQTLRQIAEAGINIDSIECVSSGDRFGCFIWIAPERVEALARLLAEQGAQRPRREAGSRG